jgi:hypothetical protein
MCSMRAEIYSEGMLIPDDNSSTFSVIMTHHHKVLRLHKLHVHVRTKSLCVVTQHSRTDNYSTQQLFTFPRLFYLQPPN